MSENPLSVTKRLVLFGLAVMFVAWTLTIAVSLIASIWWQLLIIGGIVVGAVVGIATWRSRR